MSNFSKIEEHPLIEKVMTEVGPIIEKYRVKGTKSGLDTEKMNESEYYLYIVAFSITHLTGLCKQLEQAIELLSNFRYNKKNKVQRVEHLHYNIENYFIRLISLSDRILQAVNEVFFLKIEEGKIGKGLLKKIKNSSTFLPQHFNEFQESLTPYIEDRNKIVHRYSYAEYRLGRIKILYYSLFDENDHFDTQEKQNNFKAFRKNQLTRYIHDMKKKFNEINGICFDKILPILDDLLDQYEKLKLTLEQRIY